MTSRKRSVGDLRRNGPLGTLRSTVKKLKYTLQRVRLDRGGYTSSGKYYGIGAPLYEAYNPETGESLVFRAADRATAKRHVEDALNAITNNPLALADRFSNHDVKMFKYGTSHPDEIEQLLASDR